MHALEFADPLALQRIGSVVQLGEKGGVDSRNIGMHRDQIFGEIPIDEIAEARIKRHPFLQCGSDAERHSADGLRPRGLGVQDMAGGEYAEHASHSYLAGIHVDADLGEMRAVGLLREILVVAARLDFAVGIEAGAYKLRQTHGLFYRCDVASLNRAVVGSMPAIVASFVPDGRALMVTTIRTHDQYNTTIYGMNDRYRGITGRRDVAFVNDRDLTSRGLKHGDLVDITVVSDVGSNECKRGGSYDPTDPGTA
jgi:hypothetical protein